MRTKSSPFLWVYSKPTVRCGWRVCGRLFMRRRARRSSSSAITPSLAAVLFDAARKWLSTLWGAGSGTAWLSNPSSQAPIAVAMIAAFCLILPRFCRKSACLFRSWRAGLIRGTTLVWGLAAFLYWTQRKHLLLFALAGIAFEAATDAWDPMRRKQEYPTALLRVSHIFSPSEDLIPSTRPAQFHCR